MKRLHQRIEKVISETMIHLRPASCAVLLVCGFAVLSGCQTLAGPQDFGSDPIVQEDSGTSPPNPVVQVSAESSLVEKSKKNATVVMNFMTGREQENVSRAQVYYKEGDALFRKASKLPQKQGQDMFEKAARKFQSASESAPKTALEQDSMYMQAESLFFADRLMEASDVYENLQKKFPRSRHVDRVASRLFSISRYWVNIAKAEKGSWWRLNLTDPKRPRMDVDGHAIRLLDQIRYDDPTGKLADDATMAAAAEYIRQQKFEDADEFLTDLRETFSDSEHLFLAHLLGIRCKLEVYQGPRYSGLVLEEAKKLVKQTRQRFPDKMAEGKYGEMVARAAAEIDYHQAERYANRAEYREKRKEYGAARVSYNELLKNHGQAPQAKIARARLAQIEKLPAVPKQRLSFLTEIFPDSKSSKPLIMTTPSGQTTEQPRTMLR
ncbi:MAG: tol-pal system YbgF family protein [Rubripirellula sp.]